MPEPSSPLSLQDQQQVWHPYTQMKTASPALPILRGEGALLFDELGQPYIDAISSWWVNIHGHSHPYIARKLFEQANTLEHCIFAGFTHPQAVTLAGRLLPLLPGQMSKIFFTDDGSTAVEAALKMAIQYWTNQGRIRPRILALEHAYHGDTFGAMSVSGRSVFTRAFEDYLFEVEFAPLPGHGEWQPQADPSQYAALILEPLVLGSGGMLMYSAGELEKFIHRCRAMGMLIIADEVMTGFGRTGKLFAMDGLETPPDIICLSKGITGGTMALGVTACAEAVYSAFLSTDRTKTLFHGHSYTANPLACAAANASLDLVEEPSFRENMQRVGDRHAEFAHTLKGHPRVRGIRQTGTILAFDIVSDSPDDYIHPLRDWIYQYFLDRRIILRPLGNTVYLMPPYCITNAELDAVYHAIGSMVGDLPRN